MTEQEFWSLIDLIDKDMLTSGYEEAFDPLFRRLLQESIDRLFEYEEVLARKLFDLDGKSYYRSIRIAPEADGFLYLRLYVVARGKDYYQSVRVDPTTFPSNPECFREDFLVVHRAAWSELTGKDESEWNYKPSVSYESFSNRLAWA